MKTPRFFALLLAGLLALLAPRPAEARVETSFDFFYDSLSPYGEWVQVADYGFCWRPTDVDQDWAPYSDGYWAFTDAGWTWVSYEDFGGIVYHYGRWVRVEDEGWCWVPDYEWGPAWVSWRNNDDYIGWAPLPPEARWQPSIGISVWVDRDCDIGPAYYSFCRVRDFGAPVLRPVIINRFENVTIIRRTVNITNITYNTHYSSGPVIYNGGPSFAFINERSSRRIPALKLVQNTNIDLNSVRDGNRGDRDRRRNFNGQAVGNQLVVTAPYVKPPTDPGFLRPQVKKVIGADKVSRGWGMVKNDDVRREMKQEMQRQTKGATRDTAPARAVAVTDLKVLPEKADPQAPSPVADRGNRDGRDRDGRESRDGRDNRDRSDRSGTSQPATAGQRTVTPPVENGTTRPTAETKPPVQMEEKNGREKGRGQDRRDSQPPVAVDPTLKPFNPGNNPDSKSGRERMPGNPGIVPPDSGRDPRTAQPGDNGGRRRGSDDGAGRMKDGADQERARQQAEAAAAQQKQLQQQQMDAQRQAEAQRQADALRQQKEAAAAAGRQRMQAEQDNAARQQAEQQRRMQRDRSNVDEQNRRAQDAEREGKRRQQMEAAGEQQRQAAEQMRRQAAERQQRGQREAAEQQRRAQEGQRQQMEAQRQQFEAQREAQRQQRQQQQPPQPRQQPQQPQAQPQVAPPGGAPAESDRERRKKKD